MVRVKIIRFFEKIYDWLNSPSKILVLCLLGGSFSVIFDGTLYQVWRLHKTHEIQAARIQSMQKQIIDYQGKIARANQPEFIEAEARKKLNLAEEGDLVFIFTE